MKPLIIHAIVVACIIALIGLGLVLLGKWVLMQPFESSWTTRSEKAEHRQEIREAEHRLTITRLENAEALVGEKWRLFKTSLLILLVGGGLTAITYVWRTTSILTVVAGRITFPVHRKLVTGAAWLSLSRKVIESEQVYNHFPEEALIHTESMAQTMAAAIRGARGNIATNNNVEQSALPVAPAQIQTPTFQTLLSSGDIARGKPLLFGLNKAGEQKRGTWEDLYSSAIAGQSGNGKSSTARSLILQSLLNGEIEVFYIADPHRHKPQGLINTLGPVINLPNVLYNETNFDIHTPINAFAVRMQRRIDGLEPCTRPVVLVIDELLSVIKNVSGAGDVVKQIGTEGRGFGCFGLFLAQSWVGSEVGGTSARDNLTSLLVHRMKKKQASTLLQDPEWSKVASGLGKGEIVFESTSDEPYKLSVPLCTPADAITVYSMVSDGNTVKVSDNIDGFFQKVSQSTQAVDLDARSVNVEHAVDCSVAPENTGVDLVKQVNEYLLEPGNSLRELARSTGIDKGQLSKILSGKKAMSENARKKLTAFFDAGTNSTADVIDLETAREKKERD